MVIGVESVDATDTPSNERETGPTILFLAPHTVSSSTRTGIGRVVVQTAQALLAHADVEFVKWDPIEGQLRYCNRDDLSAFFKTRSERARVRTNRFAERRRYRFEDTLPPRDRRDIWLFCPEMSYQSPITTEIFASILTQAREYGIRTAAVFYDLIPITNPHYDQGSERDHERYVHALLNVDLVLPISIYSAEELDRYYRDRLNISADLRRKAGHAIVPLPLATLNDGRGAHGRSSEADETRRDVVVLLGTVEPRKQQLEVLRAFKARGIGRRYALKAVVVGSLHPFVAGEFLRTTRDDPHIEYSGHASDDEISSLFGRSRFSVFASNDEGFGLPICESLARGVPCLTANFGAMREVGEGGGCLLIDVNDPEELGAALERLAQDDALCATLEDEISRRSFRTWDDYARDALRLMADHIASRDDGRLPTGASASAIRAFGVGQTEREVVEIGDDWVFIGLRSLDSDIMREIPASAGTKAVAVYFAGTGLHVERLDEAAADGLFEADVWLFDDETTYRRLIALARARAYEGILPAVCVAGSDAAPLARRAEDAIAAFDDSRRRRQWIASRERLLRSYYPPIAGGPILSIVVSTFDRGPFVEENVRWILSHISDLNGAIKLTVVDNASTDDTRERLDRFSRNSCFEIVANAANVGLLGNLRVCATLLRARHVWVIGDDDFIAPDAFERVRDTVRSHPSLPFVFVNAGVYDRPSLGPDDRADAFIRGSRRLAPEVSPTGLYPVRDIAVEHDNLLTSISPIIFRCDILAACFNYPFTGTPFGTLIESFPATKTILESYASAEAMWLSELGIVGNAYRSRRQHRRQIHEIVMPLLWELGRKAGLDHVGLYRQVENHKKSYRDVVGGLTDQDLRGPLSAGDAGASFRIYRQAIEDD